MMKKNIFLLLLLSFSVISNAQKSNIPLPKQDPKKVDASEFVHKKSTTIKITNTTNVNQPILVINNVVYKDSFELIMNKLDANNIQNVQVLKEITAINKYGIIAKYGAIEVQYIKPKNPKDTNKAISQ